MREDQLLKKYGPLVQREFGLNPQVIAFTRHFRWLRRIRRCFKEDSPEQTAYANFLAEVAKGRHPSNVLLDRGGF